MKSPSKPEERAPRISPLANIALHGLEARATVRTCITIAVWTVFSFAGVAKVKSAFGSDVAAEVEVHDVAGMLEVVGPFEIQ